MSDTEQIATDSGANQFERCEQCHAPVDRDQRYCVNCGAHQRQVPDPAAKYMSRVTAHTGSRGALSSSPAGAAVARSGAARRHRFGDLGLLGALALALIPVAAAVGVAIGRSSNSQDSKLIKALENQRAQVTTTLVSGTAASSGGSASASTGTASTKKKAKKTASKSKTASTSSSSSAKVSKIAGSKVTAAQQSQGSSEAKKIQSSTGKNYVQAANNLPSSVVVGP